GRAARDQDPAARLVGAPQDRSDRSLLSASRRSECPDRGRRRCGEGPHSTRQGRTLRAFGGWRQDDTSGARRAAGRRAAKRILPVMAGPEEEILPTCEELGIGFVPWSPLGAGFLTG